ncbi:MAG TPA: vitamin K epoxide reductase family protein [Candidatus Sulfotelmatobacter sp.]|nr:vitamin K epoxide reductase family protein [Candidatus Sulfotelmatobacter sp.]
MTTSADNLQNGSADGNSRVPKSVKYIFWAIAVLSVAGMIVSAVSLQRHYAKSATSYCDFGEKFNCDIVNRSEYSELLGIPVAGIGFVGYGVLLALSTFYRERADTPFRLLVAAAAGLAFALYLTYVEGYVLTTWCVLCLTSLGIIFAISVLAGVAKLWAAKVA